jgi:hypothetical protein
MITTSIMNKKREPVHYVTNKDLSDALIAYTTLCRAAKENGEPRPRIPEFLGECFLKIATRFSYRPNFVNYPYVNDLISDAVENCCRYCHNYNPEFVSERTGKKINAFNYITQIVYYAFIRRIKIEKLEMEKASKILERLTYDEVMVDEGSGTDNYSDYNSIKDNVFSRLRQV